MENNGEFIQSLYNVCKMGKTSTKDLLNMLLNKENKIKDILTDELNEYEMFLSEIEDIINENNYEMPGDKVLANIGISVGMMMDLMKDNSDARIADMLIQGYTMGILEVKKKMKQYKGMLDKKEINLGKTIIKSGESNIKILNKYL